MKIDLDELEDLAEDSSPLLRRRTFKPGQFAPPAPQPPGEAGKDRGSGGNLEELVKAMQSRRELFPVVIPAPQVTVQTPGPKEMTAEVVERDERGLIKRVKFTAT